MATQYNELIHNPCLCFNPAPIDSTDSANRNAVVQISVKCCLFSRMDLNVNNNLFWNWWVCVWEGGGEVCVRFGFIFGIFSYQPDSINIPIYYGNCGYLWFWAQVFAVHECKSSDYKFCYCISNEFINRLVWKLYQKVQINWILSFWIVSYSFSAITTWPHFIKLHPTLFPPARCLFHNLAAIFSFLVYHCCS